MNGFGPAKKPSCSKLSVERVEKLEAYPGGGGRNGQVVETMACRCWKSAFSRVLRKVGVKSEVRATWAQKVGIGPDQIHKYLRLAETPVRAAWSELQDGRGRRR